VASQLKSAHHQEHDEVAHVKARCGWIKADVERDWSGIKVFQKCLAICRLREKSTPFKIG
jgi:hypothetical protein